MKSVLWAQNCSSLAPNSSVIDSESSVTSSQLTSSTSMIRIGAHLRKIGNSCSRAERESHKLMYPEGRRRRAHMFFRQIPSSSSSPFSSSSSPNFQSLFNVKTSKISVWSVTKIVIISGGFRGDFRVGGCISERNVRCVKCFLTSDVDANYGFRWESDTSKSYLGGEDGREGRSTV